MVSMREVNRYRIDKLSEGNVLLLLKWLADKNKKEVSLKRSEAIRYLYENLKKANFSDERISVMLGVDIRYLKRMRLGGRFTKGFRNAMELFGNPVAILQKSDNYDYIYTIHRSIVESIMIEKLVRAGWTTRQIAAATGQGYRRIQRVAKKIKEAEDD